MKHFIIIVLVVILTLVGCSGSTKDNYAISDSRCSGNITLYSGGRIVREWVLEDEYVPPGSTTATIYFNVGDTAFAVHGTYVAALKGSWR